jgi:hypothetical protein
MNKADKWYKGLFSPQNSDKYKGKRPIVYRSNWEKNFMHYCDTNPRIIQWASESIMIPYFNPVKNKMTRYYPDFLITYLDADGNQKIDLIEVKPFRQTIKPVARKGKKQSTLLMEAKTYAMNDAKWKAAKIYCQQRNISFRILTEKDLFGIV